MRDCGSGTSGEKSSDECWGIIETRVDNYVVEPLVKIKWKFDSQTICKTVKFMNRQCLRDLQIFIKRVQCLNSLLSHPQYFTSKFPKFLSLLIKGKPFFLTVHMSGLFPLNLFIFHMVRQIFRNFYFIFVKFKQKTL